jgi:hypothetical protein
MSSGRCFVAVIHHSFVQWWVTFYHKEAVINELMLILWQSRTCIVLLYDEIWQIFCTNGVIFWNVYKSQQISIIIFVLSFIFGCWIIV